MLPYYPALRGKPGEFAACGRVALRYQAHICPRFIVPPPSEPDPEKGRVPTLDEIAHMMGDRMGKSWPMHPAFVDVQYASDALGDDGVEALFRIALEVNDKLVPVFTIPDLMNSARRKLLRGSVGAGIYLDFEEADPSMVLEGIKSQGLRSEECVLFVDFTGAPLGEDFAPAIAEIFDQLDGVARWRRIVYQASAYPEKLPVGADEQTKIGRTEWTTFLAALDETGVQSDRLAYGDFGADCGRMVFPKGKGGGRPRPHLRYTGKSQTLVVRGSDTGAFTPTMRKVCQQIINSGEYCGRGFSYADELIWQYARGWTDTCGDATGWREINTAHHLVRIVRDLGTMSGVSFEDDKVSEYSEQGALF